MLPLHPSLLSAALCALALSGPPYMVAQNAASNPPVRTGSRDAGIQTESLEQIPDSPGAIWAKSQSPVPNPATQSGTQSDPQSADHNQADHSKDEKLQRPVGTAAAEAPKVSGVTAAQPSGAAIAPARQHRVRTIVLRVGAILGASAAVGTVVALSAATPSKPPGAH